MNPGKIILTQSSLTQAIYTSAGSPVRTYRITNDTGSSGTMSVMIGMHTVVIAQGLSADVASANINVTGAIVGGGQVTGSYDFLA